MAVHLLKIVLCYLGKDKHYKFRLNCTKSECYNIPNIYIGDTLKGIQKDVNKNLMAEIQQNNNSNSFKRKMEKKNKEWMGKMEEQAPLSSPPLTETPELHLMMRRTTETTHTGSSAPALGLWGPGPSSQRPQAPALPAGGLALAISPSFITSGQAKQWTSWSQSFPPVGGHPHQDHDSPTA